MKNIRKYVFIGIVFIIIILLIIKIFSTIKSNSKEEKINRKLNITAQEDEKEQTNVTDTRKRRATEEEWAEKPNYTGKPEIVTNATEFYTVKNCIKNYMDDINKAGAGFTKEEKLKLRVVYNKLSRRYIEQNNIILKNINSYINRVNEKYSIYIVRMFKLQLKDNQVHRFVTRAMIIQNGKIKYLNFIVFIDYIKNTFAIEPIDNEITSLENVDLNVDITKVSKNGDNSYKYEITNKEQLLKNYFEYYSKICEVAPEIAYSYLEDNFKKESFSNVDIFKNYIEQNRERFFNMKLTEYKESAKENFTEFECIDESNNRYVINNFGVMRFTLKFNI